MGIIKAAAGAIGGGLADQWLEVIEPEEMIRRCLLPVRQQEEERIQKEAAIPCQMGR